MIYSVQYGAGYLYTNHQLTGHNDSNEGQHEAPLLYMLLFLM